MSAPHAAHERQAHVYAPCMTSSSRWHRLVLAHGSPCRALRAYFLSLEVEKCMGAASSEGAIALANESESVVELVPKVGGGFVETIHHLT